MSILNKPIKRIALALGIMAILPFLLILWSCKTTVNKYAENWGYDLSKPDEVQVLPDILLEVSGITLLDSTTLACVQDENGVLFIYDLIEHRIKQQIEFYGNGDYEGLCHVGTSIFVLRSDGALFEVSDYDSEFFHVISYETAMPGSNNEGLCYDEQNKRLLIARKNKIAKGKEFKNKRAVYEFDLTTKKLNKQPVFEFDIDTVKKLAIEEKIELPTKGNKKGKTPQPIIRFASSEIAIHPITKKIFLLSSLDHLLFVIDQKGKVEYIEKLDPIIFRQPEGIAFHKNGDMLITNEGQDKQPTLLLFNYRAVAYDKSH